MHIITEFYEKVFEDYGNDLIQISEEDLSLLEDEAPKSFTIDYKIYPCLYVRPKDPDSPIVWFSYLYVDGKPRSRYSPMFKLI
jgi:hypothetical protein